MWNVLIVLIIAIAIFTLSPLKAFNFKAQASSDWRIKKEVNQLVDITTQEVNDAHKMLEEEQKNLDN